MLRKNGSHIGTGFSTSGFAHLSNTGLSSVCARSNGDTLNHPLGKHNWRYWRPSTWKIKIFKTSYKAEICFNYFMSISVLWERNSCRRFSLIKTSIHTCGVYSSGSALYQLQSASLPPSVPQTSHKPLHFQPGRWSDKTRNRKENPVTMLWLCLWWSHLAGRSGKSCSLKPGSKSNFGLSQTSLKHEWFNQP